MTPQRLFRLTIVVTILWTFVSGVVVMLTLRSLPAPLLDYLRQTPADRPALLPQSLDRGVALLIGAIASIAILVVLVGLWRFRRWGRTGYVVITFLYFLSMIFAPPAVLPAPAFASFAIGYLFQGALITMAFLPPIALLFTAPKV